MKTLYKTLNNIQTHLLTWGDPFDCSEDVIICITGNPGIPHFYTEFCSALHKSIGLPICVIGQAGHVVVPDEESNVLEHKEHLLNLQGQLRHKLDLINNHISKSSKLHFIGHSIGAWMVAELLQKDDSIFSRVSSVNLLCPTIQRMAESKNGKYLNGIGRKLHVFVMLLFSLLYLIPDPVRVYLVNIYLKLYSLPSHYSDRILMYLHPKVAEKVLFLAYDEMDNVTKLNTDAIDKIKSLTNVIYSNRDGWAPVEYMNDLRPFQPALVLREVSINHAFVLKYSERVAEMVADFIKTKV